MAEFESELQQPRLEIPEMQCKKNEHGSDTFYDAAIGLVFVLFEAEQETTEFERFCDDLSNECATYGMQVAINPRVFNRQKLKRELKKINVYANTDSSFPLVVIVISDDSYWKEKSIIYEHRFSIPIQLEASDLLNSYDSAVLRKLSMEINIKLGGLNYRIVDAAKKNLFDKNVSAKKGCKEDEFGNGDLIVAFNARKFSLPSPFAESYEDICKQLWTVGYSANCIKDRPTIFASNSIFMHCRLNEIGKRLNYDEILDEILKKYTETGMQMKRLFLIFTVENAVDPLPLFGIVAQRIKTRLRNGPFSAVPTILLSYNHDNEFVIPEKEDSKLGKILSMRHFFGHYASLDIRFVASCKEASVRPVIARICTMEILNTDVNCFDLAQFVFNLYFCRQTVDCLYDPMPAPVFYAMEIAKRSRQLFLAQVKQPTRDGNTRRVIELCNRRFTYSPRIKDGSNKNANVRASNIWFAF